MKTEVRFYLKKNKSTALVMARLYYNNKDFRMSTGIVIDPKSWNEKKQRTYDSAPYNKQLDELEDKILLIYKKAKETGTPLSNEYVKAMARDKKSLTPQTFFDAYESFVSIHTGDLSEASIRGYRSLQVHLLDFEAIRKIPLTFSDFTLYTFDDFRKYFLKKKMLNNTIGKYFKSLRRFFKWSHERGFHTNEAYLKYKNPKGDKTDIIYLTEEELTILRNHKFSKEVYQEECDAYLLRCYTGLRYSDLKNLKPEAVFEDYIELTTIKTKERIMVPLSTEAKAIIKKYIDRPKFLSIRTNQKSNEMIKDIMQEAKINSKVVKVRFSGSKRIEKTYPKWSLLTTHTARKTFVTLSRKRGIPDDLIMKITGIKDYKTLAKYKHIDDDQVKKAMLDAWK